jgi:hypothetical protein
MPSLDNVRKEPESEVQVEQLQEEYDGPQVASCVGTNIVCEQGKPDASHQYYLSFLLNHYLYVKFYCPLSL